MGFYTVHMYAHESLKKKKKKNKRGENVSSSFPYAPNQTETPELRERKNEIEKLNETKSKLKLMMMAGGVRKKTGNIKKERLTINK